MLTGRAMALGWAGVWALTSVACGDPPEPTVLVIESAAPVATNGAEAAPDVAPEAAPLGAEDEAAADAAPDEALGAEDEAAADTVACPLGYVCLPSSVAPVAIPPELTLFPVPREAPVEMGETFFIDAEGYLVDEHGARFLGYAIDEDGQRSEPGPVSVSWEALPPRATSVVHVAANIDADNPVVSMPFDAQDPSMTCNFSTSIVVYDSLGSTHLLEIYFAKHGPGWIDYYVVLLANDVTTDPELSGSNVYIDWGTLTFATDGSLVSHASTLTDVNFLGAEPGQRIALDLGTPTADGGTGLDGVTQFGAESNVSAQTQDGRPAGFPTGLAIDEDGAVIQRYSTGVELVRAQLILAGS